MAVGGTLDTYDVRDPARKLSRSWTVGDVVRIKARVPFHPNGWNTCAKVLNNFGAAIGFIFVLSLSAPQVRNIFGLGEVTALALSFSLLAVALFLVVIAEGKKARPPRWASGSLDDFYTARGDIAAMPTFQALLSSLAQDASLEMSIWTPYEIEWCSQAPIIIIWRLRYGRVTIGVPPTETTKLVCEDKVPLAVFDFANKRMIDPPSL